jgi:hypothetical protein
MSNVGKQMEDTKNAYRQRLELYHRGARIMPDITTDQIRELYEQMKPFKAETPVETAKAWFLANESCHNDWDILTEPLTELYIQLAVFAHYEIETGKKVKDN